MQIGAFYENAVQVLSFHMYFRFVLFIISLLTVYCYSQNWVTATDIRISLDRLNTFGDEVFGDPQVLKSYFYAIADVAIGARCKCNGHSDKCVVGTGKFFSTFLFKKSLKYSPNTNHTHEK